MKLEKMVLGAMHTNCYIVINEQSKEAIIIDPCAEAKVIIAYIQQQNLKPVAILLTHGHFDHIMAVDDLRVQYQIRVYGHQDEAALVKNGQLNLSAMFGEPFETTIDDFVADDDIITLASFEIRCIHTPGHTSGGVCYYIEDENVLISGDTLFFESYGRIDFPTGNGPMLTRSIKEKLFLLPDQTIVYPGHEGDTTIAHEKLYNPI